jgi:hypothetical protein
MTRLGASEREVVLTVADDGAGWSVFSDSARFTRRVLRVAAGRRASPERLGAGYHVTLPLAAVRLIGPRRQSDAQRAQLDRARAGRQNANFRATALVATTSGAGAGAEGVS